MSDSQPQYQEIWHTSPAGAHLCVLINGDVGWLAYLRGDGDAGFSSRNPEYTGPADATIEFKLNNGQVDAYPKAWCYAIETLRRAERHFIDTGLPPTFVEWHNDSRDGKPIIPREPRDPERFGRARW